MNKTKGTYLGTLWFIFGDDAADLRRIPTENAGDLSVIEIKDLVAIQGELDHYVPLVDLIHTSLNLYRHWDSILHKLS